MTFYIVKDINGNFKLSKKPKKKDGIICMYGPYPKYRADWWLRIIKNRIKENKDIEIKPCKIFKVKNDKNKKNK